MRGDKTLFRINFSFLLKMITALKLFLLLMSSLGTVLSGSVRGKFSLVEITRSGV